MKVRTIYSQYLVCGTFWSSKSQSNISESEVASMGKTKCKKNFFCLFMVQPFTGNSVTVHHFRWYWVHVQPARLKHHNLWIRQKTANRIFEKSTFITTQGAIFVEKWEPMGESQWCKVWLKPIILAGNLPEVTWYQTCNEKHSFGHWFILAIDYNILFINLIAKIMWMWQHNQDRVH